jgi:cytochrome c-type biogenesis protein CcmE
VLAVRYLGIDVPDMFKDGAEVVVEGHFASGTFLAERVMAKCPSKYEAKVGEKT